MTSSSTAYLSRKPPITDQHNHEPQDKSMMSIRGGPPMSNTRTSLPQIKSKFDLEPNPFEQSFKDNPSEAIHSIQPNTSSPSLDHLLNAYRPRRARSSSPHHFSSDNRLTPPVIRQSPDGTLAKVSLPGISFITSPAIPAHQNGASSSKCPSPPNLLAHQSVQSSRSPSTLAYSWNSGGLGDSLRTGPLSPALSYPPAPDKVSQSVVHTGLTPIIAPSGVITPGTQALIALLSCDEESNGIPGSTDAHNSTLSSTAIGTSDKPSDIDLKSQSDPSLNLPHQVDLQSTISINTPSSNTESLGAASHRSMGPTVHPITSLPVDSTSKSSSSSAFKDVTNSTKSDNCSPPSSSTLDLPKTNIMSSCSRLANDSSTPANGSSTSPSSKSMLAHADYQSSMSTSIGPSGVRPLHSISSLGLTQSTLSAIGSFPCSTVPSGSTYVQSTIPLAIPAAPSIRPFNEITAPISPSRMSRGLIAPLPSNSGDCIDDQYNTNPLYLLTVAHEASSRMSQLSNRRETLDDATATAAAALTGLGSSGGSRYSSPGPSINPNGAMGSHNAVINHIHSSQSIKLNPEGNVASATSPRLVSLRTNTLTDSPSINPRVILRTDHEADLLSAHQAPPFTMETRQQHLNVLFPEGTPLASGSAQLSHPSSYPSHNIGLIRSTNDLDVNAPQPFSSVDSSATKKKGKKRKDGGDNGPEIVADPQFMHSKGEMQSSSCLPGPSASRVTGKGLRTAASTHKTKKTKRSKAEDLSGDDTDSRDGYWGPEDDASFMKQRGTEEPDSKGYPRHFNTNSNYNPDHPAPSQPASSGKPETEEEKRKNFLERNRQAALKCRQRKKAWLANLQTKIEFLSTENESLQLTISRLREEVDSFRNILVSHKDCPIAIGNGSGAATTIGDLMGRDASHIAANTAAVLTQQHHENNARVTMRHPQGPSSLHGQAHISAALSSAHGSLRPTHHNSHGAIVPSFGY